MNRNFYHNGDVNVVASAKPPSFMKEEDMPPQSPSPIQKRSASIRKLREVLAGATTNSSSSDSGGDPTITINKPPTSPTPRHLSRSSSHSATNTNTTSMSRGNAYLGSQLEKKSFVKPMTVSTSMNALAATSPHSPVKRYNVSPNQPHPHHYHHSHQLDFPIDSPTSIVIAGEGEGAGTGTGGAYSSTYPTKPQQHQRYYYRPPRHSFVSMSTRDGLKKLVHCNPLDTSSSHEPTNSSTSDHSNSEECFNDGYYNNDALAFSLASITCKKNTNSITMKEVVTTTATASVASVVVAKRDPSAITIHCAVRGGMQRLEGCYRLLRKQVRSELKRRQEKLYLKMQAKLEKRAKMPSKDLQKAQVMAEELQKVMSCLLKENHMVCKKNQNVSAAIGELDQQNVRLEESYPHMQENAEALQEQFLSMIQEATASKVGLSVRFVEEEDDEERDNGRTMISIKSRLLAEEGEDDNETVKVVPLPTFSFKRSDPSLLLPLDICSRSLKCQNPTQEGGEQPVGEDGGSSVHTTPTTATSPNDSSSTSLTCQSNIPATEASADPGRKQKDNNVDGNEYVSAPQQLSLDELSIESSVLSQDYDDNHCFAASTTASFTSCGPERSEAPGFLLPSVDVALKWFHRMNHEHAAFFLGGSASVDVLAAEGTEEVLPRPLHVYSTFSCS